jgi:hypothetical protein
MKKSKSYDLLPLLLISILINFGGCRQQWLVCMEKFAVFVRNYEDPWQPDLKPPEIKVALIDDGVDTAHASLSCIIADGKSFSQKSNGQYNSYYKSSRGHGTIMATLIRKICPGVKLYVARLNEERTNNGFEITAASAALVSPPHPSLCPFVLV